MARSSEDVLLMVGHVRYKKADGTLYIMDKRLGWMPDGRDSFSMSYMYQDIKMQKISAEGKSKIQLQIVLHDGASTTFHFVNPHDLDSQRSDRDGVKELLQQLLPKFKRKPSKELQEKNKFLTENPHLLHLYKELVITQVITPEEFWSQYVNQENHNNNNNNNNNGSNPPPAIPLKQNIGVPSAFLAEIRPQTDGCNGLRYNLTPDTIEAIFRTYPAVRKKHLEHVPHKMTEQDFWTRFFQSHYYHRDRTNYASKDMFADCAKTDEQDIANAMKKVSDPLLDLSQMKDTSLEEGYGSSSSSGPSQASNHITHTAIIRRYNHHSTRVLQACEEKQDGTSSIEDGASDAKRRKLAEKLEYEDLEERPQMRGAAMTLAKADRYRHGPTVAVEQVNHEVVYDNWNKISCGASRWEPRLSSCLPPSLAVSVLGELSPSGILMKSNCDIPSRALPQSIAPELCQLYICAQELLRHFWCTFPPTTPQLQQKAVRMRDTLERFHSVKVRQFEERLHREIGSSECLAHLQQLLRNAMEKFNAWQQRSQIPSIR